MWVDTLTYVKDRLKKCSPEELKALSEATGVKPWTIRRIASGDTPNPGIVAVEKLREKLEAA